MGKSSAQMALYRGIPAMLSPQRDRTIFKWRKEPELYQTFMGPSPADVDLDFLDLYSQRLFEILDTSRRSTMTVADEMHLDRFGDAIANLSEYRRVERGLNVDWAESKVGGTAVLQLRREVWLNFVGSKSIILIDTPDYSKSDKRRMDSDLRFQAVRLLMHLEESGPTKQSKLTEELGIEPYSMSRLLTKLELHHYVTRGRAGIDKIVSLMETR